MPYWYEFGKTWRKEGVMMQILVTVLVLVGVIGLYIGSYVLNKNTPVPEGIIPLAQCSSCSTTSCASHPGDVKDDLKKHLSNAEEDCEYEI